MALPGKRATEPLLTGLLRWQTVRDAQPINAVIQAHSDQTRDPTIGRPEEEIALQEHVEELDVAEPAGACFSKAALQGVQHPRQMKLPQHAGELSLEEGAEH